MPKLGKLARDTYLARQPFGGSWISWDMASDDIKENWEAVADAVAAEVIADLGVDFE